MLDLIELEQFIAFADCGTLSKAAEQLHISQPTITRTMQHLEEAFGVPLFIRGKNKIALNDTGTKAVDLARHLLSDARDTIRQVQAYDKSLHTIVVESCAPAPLWTLLPELSSAYPGMTISSGLKDIEIILKNVASGICDIGILPCQTAAEGISCVPFLRETLFLCVPPSHDLFHKKVLTFEDLNGFNFLLRSEIGFWDRLCRQKMPSSKFLVQTDDFAFNELVRESSLPCFTTNLVSDSEELFQGRRIIPVTDPEADVTYHLLFPSGSILKEMPRCTPAVPTPELLCPSCLPDKGRHRPDP